MRVPCSWLPCLWLCACADDARPTVLPAPAAAARGDAGPVPAPVTADPGLQPEIAVLLREAATTLPAGLLAQPDAAVAGLLAAGATASPIEQGRVPGLLTSLGPAALPGLAQALGHADAVQRRLAVLTLAQLGRTAAPVAPQLEQARQDPDPQVRALAEHAYKRAIGDTQDLDRQRAEYEAALRKDH